MAGDALVTFVTRASAAMVYSESEREMFSCSIIMNLDNLWPIDVAGYLCYLW